MIDRIYLRNFKCFDELSLSVSSLSLLTGFNATGKSTALQPLLLLAQSLRLSRVGAALSLNGELVKLGTAGEILNEHAAQHERSLSIGVGQGSADIRWHLRADDRTSSPTLTIDHLRLVKGRAGEVPINPAAGIRTPKEYSIIIEYLSKIIYLSAVRLGSAETFPSWEIPNPVHADVGVQGEFAPWWFERFLDEEIDLRRRHPGEPAITLRRQLNAWASDLFPGADVNAQRIQHTSLVRLELRTQTTEAYRRPANIGYGLTYAFPILVALLLAREGQAVIIDSPEAHLHPRAQSVMGGILARFAAAGVQIFIETHSDHVLNGVRRAVNSKIIDHRDVKVHFFSHRKSDLSQSQVISPSFDVNGNLSEWPEGFFDQAETDLAFLAGWS